MRECLRLVIMEAFRALGLLESVGLEILATTLARYHREYTRTRTVRKRQRDRERAVPVEDGRRESHLMWGGGGGGKRIPFTAFATGDGAAAGAG
jgi:hypothetical protein